MVNKNIKKLYFIMKLLTSEKLYFIKIEKNNHLIILNLHKISSENNPFYPSLYPVLFEILVQYIRQHFNVITFSEINKYRETNKPNIILSFDDGFLDFKECAMPILKKYNIRANLNIIPHCVESNLPVWDVKLGDYLNQIPIQTINNIDFSDFNIKLTSKNKSQFGLALTRYLKNMSYKEREQEWLKIEEKMNNFDIQYTKMLSREDILTIGLEHEIGVHSYSHESMGIETNEFFNDDFFKSQEYFKNILNIPLNIYAFPSGSYRSEQINFLKNNGIEHILLVNDMYSNNDVSVHNRFTFYGISESEIKMRALGWKK